MNIGKAIKDLRKALGLSQTHLARDICSQAQLSKIENFNEIPSAVILYKLSKKLGVDMNYFFEFVDTPRLDYIKDVQALIEECKRDRNYQRLRDIIHNERRNPLFQSTERQQYLMWHEAICFHYLDKNTEKAIEKLEASLNLTTNLEEELYAEQEIEILNSIAIIKKDQKKYEEAEKIFQKCLEVLKYKPRYNILIKIRILYGMSKLLTDRGKYEESIHYCLEGIKTCKKMEVLYLFGELQYQLGSNFARMRKIQKAKDTFNNAIKIFEVQDNVGFVQLVEKSKKKLLP